MNVKMLSQMLLLTSKVIYMKCGLSPHCCNLNHCVSREARLLLERQLDLSKRGCSCKCKFLGKEWIELLQGRGGTFQEMQHFCNCCLAHRSQHQSWQMGRFFWVFPSWKNCYCCACVLYSVWCKRKKEHCLHWFYLGCQTKVQLMFTIMVEFQTQQCAAPDRPKVILPSCGVLSILQMADSYTIVSHTVALPPALPSLLHAYRKGCSGYQQWTCFLNLGQASLDLCFSARISSFWKFKTCVR